MSLRLDRVLSAALRYAQHAETTITPADRAASEAAFRAYLDTIDAAEVRADVDGYRQRAEAFYREYLAEPLFVDMRMVGRRNWWSDDPRWRPPAPVSAPMVVAG